jgi:acyl-Coa thioesterase superfamily protein/acyl-CoA thioesterase superfamily protein
MTGDESFPGASAEAALFHRSGRWFHPTEFTTGPWRPDAMHGGPPSALCGLAVSDAVEPDEQVARINIELERPVPIEPLTTEVIRRTISRRVAHLDVVLRSESATVASARAILLRGSGPVPLIEGTAPEVRELAGPEHVSRGPDPAHDAPVVFHREAVEARYVEGDWAIPGPGTAWMRLRHPLIAGEPTPGLSALLGVADFSSALSQSVVPGSGTGMINVDVSVALTRAPLGPWFCLASRGDVGDSGIGLSVTKLFDQAGALGVVTTSQLAQKFARG